MQHTTKQDFKMPRDWSVQCNAKPSLFAYPKKLEDKKEEKKERVTTVTLSTTAKVRCIYICVYIYMYVF